MVLFFSAVCHTEGTNEWLVYMGKDKFENEDLIKYGLPEDVWCALHSKSIYLVFDSVHRSRAMPVPACDMCVVYCICDIGAMLIPATTRALTAVQSLHTLSRTVRSVSVITLSGAQG